MKPNITLQQLAEHLQRGELIHKKFDFAQYNSWGKKNDKSKIPNCGTFGCAIGEMPALDNRFRFLYIGMAFETEPVTSGLIADYFGIEKEAAEHLFYANKQQPWRFGGHHLDYDATLFEVVYNLIHYLDNYHQK
jgi:hypothetical protein